MSINSGARGLLTIWLFGIDIVFVNILDGYMIPIFLLLTTSHIGAVGVGILRLRLAVIVYK